MINKTNSLNLWQALQDWVECMPVALQVSAKEPVCVALALMSSVVLIIFPAHRDYAGQRFAAQLVFQFAAVALACKAVWRQDALMSGSDSEPSANWIAICKAFVNSVIYNVVTVVGSLFFLVPGFLFAVRAVLSLVVICLEGGGIIGSFHRSIELTSERYWRTLVYMTTPTLAYIVFNIVPGFLIMRLDEKAFRDQSASLQWTMMHPLIATMLITCAVIILFVQVSVAPLLTKLYVEYCDEMAELEEATA